MLHLSVHIFLNDDGSLLLLLLNLTHWILIQKFSHPANPKVKNFSKGYPFRLAIFLYFGGKNFFHEDRVVFPCWESIFDFQNVKIMQIKN